MLRRAPQRLGLAHTSACPVTVLVSLALHHTRNHTTRTPFPAPTCVSFAGALALGRRRICIAVAVWGSCRSRIRCRGRLLDSSTLPHRLELFALLEQHCEADFGLVFRALGATSPAFDRSVGLGSWCEATELGGCMCAGPSFGIDVLVRVVLPLPLFVFVAVLIVVHVRMPVAELGLHIVFVALVQVMTREELTMHRPVRLCGMRMLECGVEVESALGREECICANSV
jgi:hypothetical protein